MSAAAAPPSAEGTTKIITIRTLHFYARDVLNETAFTLSQGQYGRILWNERCTDCDEGTWYYQLHIYNLYHMQGETIPCDLFTERMPDCQYQQLARLF